MRNGGGKYHRKDPNPEVFGKPDREAGTVAIDVGRGGNVEVPVGAEFVNTVEQVAREAHYGGYYKVFFALGKEQMKELVNPDDAPEKIAAGMRIAITSYDKVGTWGA